MANIPGFYYGFSYLTTELHDYVIVTSRNVTCKNMIWVGNLPGIY